MRELKHVLSRAILMEDGPILYGNDFYPGVGVSAGMGNGRGIDMGNSEVETNLLSNALKAARGNKSKAAVILGISRKTLYNRLKKVNLFVPRR